MNNQNQQSYPQPPVPDQQPSQKKPVKKGTACCALALGVPLIALGMIFLIAGAVSIIGIGSSSTQTPQVSISIQSSKQVSEQPSEQISEESIEIKSKEEYIAECETFKYKDIARKPKDYEGKYAKFEGKVIQVIEEGNGKVTLRVNVTKVENEFIDNMYEDTVYVEYTRKSEEEGRVLEDDIINMYGVLSGIKSYDSLIGNITVPYMLAEYIDLVSE